jgi:hypothetical protein
VEDDAVYDARCGFLDAFRGPLDRFRNRRPIRRTESDITGVVVRVGDHRVAISRTADAWRWVSGAEVPGATPRRLVGRIVDLEEQAVGASPPAGPAADDPALEVAFVDGAAQVLRCGPSVHEGATAPGAAPVTAPLRWMWVDQASPIATSPALCDAAADLLREASHVAAREAERGLRADGGATPR